MCALRELIYGLLRSYYGRALRRLYDVRRSRLYTLYTLHTLVGDCEACTPFAQSNNSLQTDGRDPQ